VSQSLFYVYSWCPILYVMRSRPQPLRDVSLMSKPLSDVYLVSQPLYDIQIEIYPLRYTYVLGATSV
jgi:hypothetical protein